MRWAPRVKGIDDLLMSFKRTHTSGVNAAAFPAEIGYTIHRKKGVRRMLPYTIEEITRRIVPVAQKYGLSAVYLFGSYARGDATAESDVDLLVDLSGTDIDSLLKLGGLYSDLEEALETSIDLVTLDSMEQPTDRRSQLHFREAVERERKMIYATA